MATGSWSAQDERFLRENYQPMAMADLARSLDRTEDAIKHRARKLGLSKRVDPAPFFDKWTEYSAYTVGFWAADGTVSPRGNYALVSMSQKTRGILDQIRAAMGGPGGIFQRTIDGLWFYQFSSLAAYERLCEIFGHDVRAKSKILQWPNVPGEYMRHFVRGVFDGDGSFCWYKNGLPYAGVASGSEQFARGLQVCLKNAGVTCGTTHNKNDVYIVQCSSTSAARMAAWLYDGCAIALERKQETAQQIIGWAKQKGQQ